MRSLASTCHVLQLVAGFQRRSWYALVGRILLVFWSWFLERIFIIFFVNVSFNICYCFVANFHIILSKYFLIIQLSCRCLKTCASFMCFHLSSCWSVSIQDFSATSQNSPKRRNIWRLLLCLLLQGFQSTASWSIFSFPFSQCVLPTATCLSLHVPFQ